MYLANEFSVLDFIGISDRHYYCTIYWFYVSGTFCSSRISIVQASVFICFASASALLPLPSSRLVPSFHCLGPASASTIVPQLLRLLREKCLDKEEPTFAAKHFGPRALKTSKLLVYACMCVCVQPQSTAKGEDLIQDAIEQQLALCKCAQWYPVQRVDDGIYRVSTLCDRYQLVVC